MKAISEDDLAQIDAEHGITMELTNLTVKVWGTTLGIYDNAGKTEGVVLPSLVIGDGAGNGFGVNTTLVTDVGTSGGRTWLNASGLSLPSNASGIGITSTGVNIMKGGTAYTIGDLALTGLFLGRSVSSVGGTAITPAYTAGATSPFIRISSHNGAQGFDINSELGAYVDKVKLQYNTAGTPLTISGIYLYGVKPGYWNNDGNPNNWDNPLTGNAIIGGGTVPTYTGGGALDGGSITFGSSATFDVGTSGGNTVISLSLPMAQSIKIRDFRMDPARSWGVLSIDNMIVYKLKVNFLNL
jgi:hypothetical protein